MEQQKPDFSLITIVNKEPVYKEFKQNLQTQQDVDYELIKIQNDHHQYESARAAYNAAVKKSTGRHLIFLHPDIRFTDKESLHDIVNQALGLPNRGIVGIAGVPANVGAYHILTTMRQGTVPQKVGDAIQKPTPVQTVDECFFIMDRHTWEQQPFSDIKGWHLYAVEECLRAEIAGKTNYVVPARVCHVSDGVSENWNYVQAGRQIVERYGAEFPVINTTVYKWNTRGLRKHYMPLFHYLDHQVERKLRTSPWLHDTAKRIKHLFVKPW